MSRRDLATLTRLHEAAKAAEEKARERRAALAIEIAQALGVDLQALDRPAKRSPKPFGAPYTPPPPPTGPNRSRVPGRQDKVLALAQQHGTITTRDLVKRLAMPDSSAHHLLVRLAKDGRLRRMSPGVYAFQEETAPKAKAPKAAPTPKLARVPNDFRTTEALAFITSRAGKATSPMQFAKAAKISNGAAGKVLTALAKAGQIKRTGRGSYTTTDSSTPEAPLPAPAPTSIASQIVALAEQRGGMVNSAALVAAGLYADRTAADVRLAELHITGRLVRISQGEYATPVHAAQLKRERKAERTANTETTT